MNTGARGGALLLAFSLLTACGSARRDIPVAGPMRYADARVAEGERVYTRECSLCHPRGEAGLAPAINNKPLPAFLIRFQIRHGLGAMPAFPESELSDAEVDAIIAYLMHMRARGG